MRRRSFLGALGALCGAGLARVLGAGGKAAGATGAAEAAEGGHLAPPELHEALEYRITGVGGVPPRPFTSRVTVSRELLADSAFDIRAHLGALHDEQLGLALEREARPRRPGPGWARYLERAAGLEVPS